MGTKFDDGGKVSEVDLNNFDPTRFPRIKEVEFYSVVLEPGDILYNPRRWWHYVKSLDVSISVNNFGATLWDVFAVVPRERVKKSLHCRGLYRANDCTCHKTVNGQRVSK